MNDYRLVSTVLGVVGVVMLSEQRQIQPQASQACCSKNELVTLVSGLLCGFCCEYANMAVLNGDELEYFTRKLLEIETMTNAVHLIVFTELCELFEPATVQ